MNPLLSSGNAFYQTPPEIIEASRLVLGRIELDPASNAKANEVVKADRFYSEPDNCLEHPFWEALTVFLNPPGSRIALGADGVWRLNGSGSTGKSAQKLFWNKLYHSWSIGKVGSAIYIAFNLNAAIPTNPEMAKLPRCNTSSSATSSCINGSGRIKFIHPETGIPNNKPTHAGLLLFLPNRRNFVRDCERFQKYFSQFGEVTIPG